ncbi:hypothetical protein JW711_00820 [Candidatus Woesearchaeota archaeon]|nr:hypothetical protein [Candidatus Woesearchaeota archaeon]
MGILDAFKRKKGPEDDFGGGFNPGPDPRNDPNAGYPPTDQSLGTQQGQGYPGSPGQYGSDPMEGMPGPDPYGSQGSEPYGGYPPQQPQSQSYPGSQRYDHVPSSQPAGYPPNSGYPSQQQSQGQSVAEINIGKDLEIISAKLDAIKAELDSINQRVKRIERGSEGNGHGGWNY